MHMLSPEVIRTWAICSPLYSWRGDEAGLVYSFQVTHVDRSWMLMVLHVRLSVMDCVFSHSNRSHNILFFVLVKIEIYQYVCVDKIFFFKIYTVPTTMLPVMNLKDKGGAEQQTEATHFLKSSIKKNKQKKNHNKKHTSVHLLADLRWS